MGGQTRREWLGGVAAGAAVAATAAAADDKAEPPTHPPFQYMLNTATIMGQKLSIVDEIDVASRSGYQAIEPWARELDQYVKDGGSLKDLGKRFRDSGLTVEDCIAFPEWVVDDEAKRKKALEESRRIMDMLQQVGGKRLAAPPAGATDRADLSLLAAAERYRDLCEIGERFAITPIVEFWGPSKALNRLGEALLVAAESGRAEACVLPDIFHLYKGGSGFKGLGLVAPVALPVIHVNDYPAAPPRNEITDQFRVYPGDGTAPLKEVFRGLHANGFRGFLSLELFNHEYWQHDALLVARTGLEKMKAVAQAALEERP